MREYIEMLWERRDGEAFLVGITGEIHRGGIVELLDARNVGAPTESCYSCLGTGRIKGFGHDGKQCPCSPDLTIDDLPDPFLDMVAEELLSTWADNQGAA